MTKIEQYFFDDYDPFNSGMERLLRRIDILTEAGQLEWRRALVLRNRNQNNLNAVETKISTQHKIFRGDPEWNFLSQIFKHNSDGNYANFTFWLDMAKRSGFLDDDSSVWIIQADTVSITDDQSVFFQVSIVENMEDGGTANRVLQELHSRNKFILFVFSIEDFRALRTGELIARMSTLRPINPMAYLDDAL